MPVIEAETWIIFLEVSTLKTLVGLEMREKKALYQNTFLFNCEYFCSYSCYL